MRSIIKWLTRSQVSMVILEFIIGNHLIESLLNLIIKVRIEIFSLISLILNRLFSSLFESIYTLMHLFNHNFIVCRKYDFMPEMVPVSITGVYIPKGQTLENIVDQYNDLYC